MTLKENQEELQSEIDNYIVLKRLTDDNRNKVTYTITSKESFLIYREGIIFSIIVFCNEEFDIFIYSQTKNLYSKLLQIADNELFDKLELISDEQSYRKEEKRVYEGVYDLEIYNSRIILNGIEEFRKFLVYFDEII